MHQLLSVAQFVSACFVHSIHALLNNYDIAFG